LWAGENELERICAALHDVIENSSISLDDLHKEGFSEEVINILVCLTKRDGKSYDDFISRVLENKTASRIKLADLHDNMDLTRIKNLTEKDKERLKKYDEAAKRINEKLIRKTLRDVN